MPQDGTEVADLLKAADAAMYAGKELGKGGLCVVLRSVRSSAPCRIYFHGQYKHQIASISSLAKTTAGELVRSSAPYGLMVFNQHYRN